MALALCGLLMLLAVVMVEVGPSTVHRYTVWQVRRHASRDDRDWLARKRGIDHVLEAEISSTWASDAKYASCLLAALKARQVYDQDLPCPSGFVRNLAQEVLDCDERRLTARNRDSVSWLLAECLSVLGTERDQQARSIMVDCLVSEFPWVRDRAVAGIGELGNFLDAPLIVNAAEDPNAMVAVRALRVLTSWKCTEGIPVAQRAVADSARHNEVRTEAAVLLLALDWPEADKLIRPFAEHLLQSAVHGVQDKANSQKDHPNPEVGLLASLVEAVFQTPGPGRWADLFATMARSQTVEVRRALAMAIAMRPSEKCRGVMKMLEADNDPDVRFYLWKVKGALDAQGADR